MQPISLGSLPDELVLDIVEYLDTARDVANLASTSRHTHQLVHQDGWKTFVKTRFPTLDVPLGKQPPKWSTVANRLTYLDRCWEKRGLWLNVFHEKTPRQQGRSQRRPIGGQSVTFHAVLDARLAPGGEEEVLAAGVGENLLVRMKPQGRKGTEAWHQVDGKSRGYSAGTGDVTAVSVIERQGTSEVVVARASGDIDILSAEDSFVETRQHLVVSDSGSSTPNTNSSRKSPGQLAVFWTEWQPQANLLASCKGSVLTLHNLNDTDQTDLIATTSYDFSQDSPMDEVCLLRAAKFMSKDSVTCAFGGSREPLRWGKIRPTGLEFFNAAKNLKPLDDLTALTQARIGEKTTVRAIEAVGGGSGNMILSAWDDGTYRLIDVRTPSPHDAIYRDRFQPYEAGSSLLVYGTERFVAGSNAAPILRLFDFRQPKPYHHTTALGCTNNLPYPDQKDVPRVWSTSWPSALSICNPADGLRCPWHDLSRRNCWRPDATVHVGNTAYDHVYSLAKSSDAAGSLYCGLRGAFMEMNLQLTHQTANPVRSTAREKAPQGWAMGRPGGKVSLIETGVSLCSSKEYAWESHGVPELLVQRPQRVQDSDYIKRHRLDAAFQKHAPAGPEAFAITEA